jgi:hypothetical protein
VQVAEGKKFHARNLTIRCRGRRSPCRRPRESCPFDNLARAMPDVFWIGLGLAGFIFLVGVIAGAR